jgi:hypothetical protein
MLHLVWICLIAGAVLAAGLEEEVELDGTDTSSATGIGNIGHPEQPVVFPELSERIDYLGVALVLLGGMVILLNSIRRKVDASGNL